MDIGEQSLAAEFGIVEDVVRATAPEFAARGFTLTNVTEEGTPPYVRSLVFHFSNPRFGLLLDMSFSVGRRRTLTTMISNPGKGRLDVGDYLTLHGRSDTSALFRSDDPAVDVHEFAESSVRKLLDAFDRELKPIVEGRTWETTPIDWQGYK